MRPWGDSTPEIAGSKGIFTCDLFVVAARIGCGSLKLHCFLLRSVIMLNKYVLLSLIAFVPALVAKADPVSNAAASGAQIQAGAVDQANSAVQESEAIAANAKSQIDSALKNVENAKAAAEAKKAAADAAANSAKGLKDSHAALKVGEAHLNTAK